MDLQTCRHHGGSDMGPSGFQLHFVKLVLLLGSRARTHGPYCYSARLSFDGNIAARQNQQNDMCARQRLRSAWVSAQSDQSSLSA